MAKQHITLDKRDLGIVMERVMGKLMSEGIGDYGGYEDNKEQELDPVEEYEQGYPNGGFDPKSVDVSTLIEWCKSVGDFLYIINSPFGGMRICAANTDEIVQEIVSDLYRCSYVEPTHEVDYLITRREREFVYDYVAVMKVCGNPGPEGDYYIIYQQQK